MELLLQGVSLSREQAASAMRELMSGSVNPAQMAGFLVALRIKGETVDEIAGFAQTMREMATPIVTTRSPLVDTCGTGGDRSGTFNISTTAAFVVAGADVAVAKHGNRGATSKCGSADVLEELGVNIDATPQQVGRCIDEIGIGFLYARSLHAAMRHVAETRKGLGFRTVFNILGPLTNPAGASGQVMGIFDATLVRPIAEVLKALGARHALVVHGADGLDEVTLTAPTHVAEVLDGNVSVYEICPAQFGFEPCSRDDLLGGNAKENAGILRAILNGQAGPKRDIVLLNAAAGILVATGSSDWQSALFAARKSLDSGAAAARLDALVKVTHDS